MKRSCACILRITLVLLTVANSHAHAQTYFDASIRRIAEEEKQTFKDLSAKHTKMNRMQRNSSASDNFNVNFYRCEWEIDPNIRFIKGEVTSYFTLSGPSDNITVDLSDTLAVDSILYHGNQLIFQRTGNDGLKLQFPGILNTGQQDSVSIYYNGVPRMNTGFQPFVQTTHSGAPVVWTLSEPYGAKEWWPCKNGLNDKADSIDIIIKNPAAYQASSNGVLVQEQVDSDVKTSIWKHRYPIASYLVAMAVTNYTVLQDTIQLGGKAMDLVYYVYPETKPDFDAQLPFTKYILNLYGGLFGHYPFEKEKYGFTQFGTGSGGGMEHQTNSSINYPSTALISHESAHQWFGDKITCGSWQDIWLNEGFATYCQVLYFEDTNKDLYYDTFNSLINNITSQPDGSVWVNDTTDASRIFDTRLTYYKGCYLLHMLRWKLGEDAFFKGIKRYLNDPLLAYNFAKTGDLQRNLEQESGKNLTSFFQNWFYKEGYPNYAVNWTQDSSNNLYIKINQTASDPSVNFFDMPVPVQFKNASRDTIIVFDNIQNGQAFLTNPGFRADTAIFDPYHWILCHSSTTKLNCTAIDDVGGPLPFYAIQWFQNANNWVFVDIRQTNNATAPAGDSIALYLHFSGNGKDTIFVIKNTGTQYGSWINTGFTITNAFVSTSCIMNHNYTLNNEVNSIAADIIKIFPVPVTGGTINVSVKNPSGKQLSMALYNAAGQLIWQGKYATPGKDEQFTVPASNIAGGIYVLKLQNELTVRWSKKIIKQ